MSGLALLIILVLWIVIGVVSYKVGEAKGRGGLGLALGLLFGVLGLIVVAVLPTAERVSDYQDDYAGPSMSGRDPVMSAIAGPLARASSNGSVEDRLLSLDRLLQRRVIDETEYVQQRRRIIADV